MGKCAGCGLLFVGKGTESSGGMEILAKKVSFSLLYPFARLTGTLISKRIGSGERDGSRMRG